MKLLYKYPKVFMCLMLGWRPSRHFQAIMGHQKKRKSEGRLGLEPRTSS